MSWAKLIGGVVGAFVGGPLGAGVGVLVGSGWDKAEPGQSAVDDGDLMSERMGSLGFQQTGNALKVAAVIPSDIDVDTAIIRIAQDGDPLETFVEDFKDEDGRFGIARPLEGQTLSVDLPLHTVVLRRNETVEIQVVVALLKVPEYVGHLAESTRVRVGFEPWSVVAWLAPAVDILAHYALRHGPWTGPKVQRIKAVFGQFIALEDEEAKALRDRLKLTSLPPRADSIATYRRRVRNEGLSVALLLGVADLLRLSGCTETTIEAELKGLKRELGLSPGADQGTYGDNETSSGDRRQEAQQDVRWACSVLGVDLGASPEAIQQAWRKRITELHPDKYATLPEVVQALIKEKAQELNRARDILRC